jgi:hypothetical protein
MTNPTTLHALLPISPPVRRAGYNAAQLLEFGSKAGKQP